MEKGRDIIFYASAYIAGDVLWQILLPSPGIPAFISLAALLAAAACFCIAALCRRRPVPSVLLTLCFAILGAAGAVAGGIPRDGMPLFARAAELKTAISGMLDGLLSGGGQSEVAIAKALAIGDKSMIDTVLKNQYKASGAMHLLALSGLHVGVVYAFLNAALAFLGNSPAARMQTLFFMGGHYTTIPPCREVFDGVKSSFGLGGFISPQNVV